MALLAPLALALCSCNPWEDNDDWECPDPKEDRLEAGSVLMLPENATDSITFKVYRKAPGNAPKHYLRDETYYFEDSVRQRSYDEVPNNFDIGCDQEFNRHDMEIRYKGPRPMAYILFPDSTRDLLGIRLYTPNMLKHESYLNSDAYNTNGGGNVFRERDTIGGRAFGSVNQFQARRSWYWSHIPTIRVKYNRQYGLLYYSFGDTLLYERYIP